MLVFTVKRLLQAIPLLLISTILVFLLLRVGPNDPVNMLVSPDATEEEVEAVRRQLGLDQPLPVQYGIWMKNVFQGDLGKSFLNHQPVIDLISDRFPATLTLALAALLIGVVLSFPIGILAALNADRPIDWFISGATAVALAAPNFWIGILAIMLFAVTLHWLPPGGRIPFSQDPTAALKTLILPATIMGVRQGAVLTRFVKSSVLDVLNQNYVRTARSKGLSEFSVIMRHVLRNSLVPVVTVLGVALGRLMGGAVLIEAVFAWPGIGRLLVSSIQQQDFPVAQGVLLVMAFIFITLNLSVDVLYGVIDPRIRLGKEGGA